MTSKQAQEWLAFACIEQVGNPAHIVDEKAKRKAKRAEIENGFRTLMEKQNAKN